MLIFKTFYKKNVHTYIFGRCFYIMFQSELRFMSGVIIEDTIENFYRVNHIFVKKEIGIHSN